MNVWKRDIRLDGVNDPRVRPYKILFRQFFTNWGVYFGGCAAVVVTDFAEVFFPMLVSQLVDIFVNSKSDPLTSLSSYKKTTLLIFAVLTVQLGARIIWRLLLAQQTHYVGAKLKSLLWEKVRFLPRKRIETDLTPGELMNVATSDISIARFLFGFTLVGTVDFIFLLIFCLGAMITLDIQLTVLSLLAFAFLPFVLHRLAKKEASQHKDSQEILSTLTDSIAQSVSTTRLQKVTETSSFWKSRLLKSADTYRKSRNRLLKTSYAFIPVTGIPPLLAYLGLLILGIQKVDRGELSLGSFVAFQSYIFIIQGPLLELGTIISEWQRGFTSLGRCLNILRQAEETNIRSGGLPYLEKSDSDGDLELRIENLNFHYPESQSRPLLQNMTQVLKPGDRWGIWGPIGSGKTTLLNILSGLQSEYTGRVTLNDREIREFEHHGLRQVLSIVPQKPFLFATTVEENLRLDNESLNSDHLWEVLRVCEIDTEIRNFPGGLKAKLGEWGINLSGGQKQRLTLARALLKSPKILFLDDCLSAVDTVTEEKILKNLDSLLKKQILVWVAHRESTLKYCNIKTELSLREALS
jgi:ATP-binding cassette subfamily B multidrug efflux pump